MDYCKKNREQACPKSLERQRGKKTNPSVAHRQVQWLGSEEIAFILGKAVGGYAADSNGLKVVFSASYSEP